MHPRAIIWPARELHGWSRLRCVPTSKDSPLLDCSFDAARSRRFTRRLTGRQSCTVGVAFMRYAQAFTGVMIVLDSCLSLATGPCWSAAVPASAAASSACVRRNMGAGTANEAGCH
jgi:hypothetical protein